MFSWFVSAKKEKNFIQDTEDNSSQDSAEFEDQQNHVPQPPKANHQLAQRIRENHYDPSYYCHPNDLAEQLSIAYDNRLVRNISQERILSRQTELEQIRLNQQIKKEIERQEIAARIKETTDVINNVVQQLKMNAVETIERFDNIQEFEEFDNIIQELNNPFEKFEDIETIDWDTKLKEWGLNEEAFLDYKNAQWSQNPTFQFSENFFEDDLLEQDSIVDYRKILKFEPNPAYQCDLEEVIVQNDNELTIEDMNRISEELSHWNHLSEEQEEQEKQEETHIVISDKPISFPDTCVDIYFDIPSSIEEVKVKEEETDQINEIQKIEMEEEKRQQKEEKEEIEKIVPEHPEGYLEINMGPMFSGKSTKSLFKLTSMADQRFRCLYINSTKDIRKTESADNMVSTHNSSYSKTSPKITCVKVATLSEVSVTKFDYIAVDELQFFDDAYETILSWLNMGKYIIVSSLDGDCYRRKFGCVLDLIPQANEVTKLSAYCDICRDNYKILTRAPFTARMTSDTSAELVGGSDLYKAMCRKCHDFHLDVTVSYM